MEKEPFFPPEVTGGAFKVTLTGRGRAWVEQHQGLLGYTAEEALSARRRVRCALAGRTCASCAIHHQTRL